MAEGFEIDIDAEDELRQGVIDAAFEFCECTRTHRDNLVACAPSWGVNVPAHFMALHAAMDALLKFKQALVSTPESDSTASTTHDLINSERGEGA